MIGPVKSVGEPYNASSNVFFFFFSQMSGRKQEKTGNIPYQLFTLVLSVLVIAILLFDSTQEANEEAKRLLKWTDYGLCVLFFIDFIYQLFTAESKKRYLATWGWIDFISCIPVFGWGRIAKIIRILKLLKAIKSSKTIFDSFRRRKGESALLSAVMVLIFAVLFGSIAILQCEMDEADGNIHNASDAIWWTFCTLMKGGCENYDPISVEGRVVAVVLMFVGMAINGTVIGFLAFMLSSNGNRGDRDETPPDNA